MPVLPGVELGEHAGIAGKDARIVHHLGQAMHLGVIAQRQQFADFKGCAGLFERCRRHARRQVDADVHRRLLGAGEEVADALRAEHVGDLVGIAEDSGDTVRQDATVEFKRRHHRRFDVHMRVDEARHGEASASVDLGLAGILPVGADDAIFHDGDVGRFDRAGDEIEQAHVLDDEIGRHLALAGSDGT